MRHFGAFLGAKSSISSERIKCISKLKEKKEIIKTTHEFYCDNCGKFLGSSEEWEDGYYEKFGSFENKLDIYNSRVHNKKYKESGWYTYKKILCDKCQEEFVSKLAKTLLELGYKKDR